MVIKFPVVPSVLVVLTNWRRPFNMPQVIKAWKEQSVPPASVVVVDNSPCGMDVSYCPARELLSAAHNVWRIGPDNLGPPCRFAPAWSLGLDFDLVLFADDDLVPGRQALEFALLHAEVLGWEFSTLGQAGRWFNLKEPEGRRYSFQAAPDPYIPGKCVPCDLTCGVHLVRTDLMRDVLAFREELQHVCQGPEDRALLKIHDDFLLCQGIQWGIKWCSYILPNPPSPEQFLIKERLREDYALWKRPGHMKERNRMVDLCVKAGWQRPM